MYNVSQAYLAAIADESKQHIRGTLHLPGGDIDLTDGNIYGTPHIEKRCTESEDTFMFGQMYVGTVELTLHIAFGSSSSFRGAEISLDFGVDIEGSDEPEWVPLGVWDITSAERLIGDHLWAVKGTDRTNRLRTVINDSTVGRIRLAAVMETVERRANVQFAQTADEIAAMTGRSASSIVCVEFAETCWEEVRQIAQLIGGFAFANREGKIELRQFGASPVLTIPADRRHGLSISEYSYGVAQISYTDSKNRTCTAQTAISGGTVTLGFSANKYIFTGSEDFTDYYSEWLAPIAEQYTQAWYTGTCDYYGDPALDLGDMIAVTGGMADEDTLPMLITGLSWGFRAPQVITSAGLPDTGTGAQVYSSGSSSPGGGSSSQSGSTYLQTVHLDTYAGEISGRQIIAEGGFGCRYAVEGFVNVGVVLLADSAGTAGVTVLLDGIAQVYQPVVTVAENGYISVFASVPISPAEGSHRVQIKAEGSGIITDITAVVVGQDIAPESPEVTSESDFTYTISDGKATVTGYIGGSAYPRIPDTLGGAQVTRIAGGAFTGTAVRNVYIPEGVEEIQ